MHQLMKEIARFMVVGISGTSLTDEERKLLREFPPAGVILFFRNVSSPGQLIKLTREIQHVVGDASGVPPIICADHEGGRVSVLSAAAGIPPSQMAIGRCEDISLCRDVFAESARRAKLLGVNTILSPVADINSNIDNPVIGTRSFGENIESVERLVAASIEGLGSEDVISCAKHFPGHGATSLDSHEALPSLSKSPEEMERFELVPFKAAVSAGVPMIMVGHIAIKGEGKVAASMSEEVISGWLRNRLAFEGVAITDALEMKGAVVEGGYAEGGEGHSKEEEFFLKQLCTALSAGNDLLLYSSPAQTVYGRLERALAEGGVEVAILTDEILPGRGASIRRIRRLQDIIEKCEASARDLRSQSFKMGFNGTDTEHLFDSGPYCEVARRIIAGQSEDFKRVMQGLPLEYVRVLGEEKELLNPIVRGFVVELFKRLGLLKGGQVGERRIEPDGHHRSHDARSMGGSENLRSIRDEYGEVGRVRRVEIEGSNGRRSYYEIAAGNKDSGKQIAVFVNRHPIDSRTIRKLLPEEAYPVIISGWPYTKGHLPDGVSSMITYDIYDCLIEAVFRS